MSSINKKSVRANDPYSSYKFVNGVLHECEGINGSVYAVNGAMDHMSNPSINCWGNRFNRRNGSITRWYQGSADIKGKHSVNKV